MITTEWQLKSDLEAEAFFVRDMLEMIVDNLMEVSFLNREASEIRSLRMVNTLAIVARDRADDFCKQVDGFYANRQPEVPAKNAPNLVEAIAAFRSAQKAYEAMLKAGTVDNEDAEVEATYGPPMRAVCHWDKPLRSLDEVREAIRLAFTEQALCDDIAVEPLRAALVYLEKITGWKEPAGGEA